MPSDSQSYVGKDSVQQNRYGSIKVGTVPSVPRELGKKFPAGNEIRSKQGGSISERKRPLGGK